MAHHELMNGRLHVYKRENSRYWQCDTRIGGRRHRMTTHEDSIERAKDIAEDWYLELRGKLRRGDLQLRAEPTSRAATSKRVKEKTFREAALQFELEYTALTSGQRSAGWTQAMRDKIRIYLNPFFGDLALSEVTSGKVQDYRMNRVAISKTGKPPARSTIHHEIVTLRQVLKTAMRHGWLSALPDLSAPYRSSGKVSHRAWFSAEEYKRLYTATRERARQPKTKRWKWTSEQMHDFVLFMANTGLRPDEARHLQFRDVEIVKDDDTGETILEIEVRGKRGVGYCKSTTGAVKPFQRLQQRDRAVVEAGREELGDKYRKPQPIDSVFPGEHRELFNQILADLSLKFDRDGNRRSAYSLRHTYICLRLMEGADIYAIAKNCRTSVEMIEKFYASHIKTTLDAAAINIRKARKAKRPAEMPIDE